MKVEGWVVREASAPMAWEEREEVPGRGEVVVKVAGCGVCHTDLGFYYEGVPTRHGWPLTLGHEVSGTVVETGAGAEEWGGADVVVPAVLPCGTCPACRAGKGGVCPSQVFPGSDVHGGFATHLRVPARGLCRVEGLPEGLALSDLSVIADAVSTPYQAVRRSGLGAGDLAVFVGVGGVGGFGVQVAAAFGASVVAVDVDPGRLATLAGHGVSLTLNASDTDLKSMKGAIRKLGVPSWRTKVFETSGTPAGQATAFGLLGPGGYLGVVGYTPRTVEVRLSNLMAFDATAQGSWGCDPALYPEILDLVRAGRVALSPFLERRPMGAIQGVFEDLKAKRISRRVVLVPEA